MCLELHKDNSELKKAKKDIICYKFLRVNSDGTLLTPYQGFRIEDIPEEVTSNLIRNDNNHVNEGIHSFVELRDALLDSVDEHNNFRDNVLVKCIIPKGSHYYEGLFFTMKAIASNKLKYLEVIFTVDSEVVSSVKAAKHDDRVDDYLSEILPEHVGKI